MGAEEIYAAHYFGMMGTVQKHCLEFLFLMKLAASHTHF
jgi:hypothetical protein